MSLALSVGSTQVRDVVHYGRARVTWRTGRTDVRLAQMLHGQLSRLYCAHRPSYAGGRRAEARGSRDRARTVWPTDAARQPVALANTHTLGFSPLRAARTCASQPGADLGYFDKGGTYKLYNDSFIINNTYSYF